MSTSNIMKKEMLKSNGKAKVVKVPQHMRPTAESLRQIEREISAQLDTNRRLRENSMKQWSFVLWVSSPLNSKNEKTIVYPKSSEFSTFCKSDELRGIVDNKNGKKGSCYRLVVELIHTSHYGMMK